jgi:hypothetical protein
MAAIGFTPISLYYSATALAVPSAANLVAGELALNTVDGKLYYKSSAGVVTLLAGATAGPAGGSNTQVQFNNSGALAGSANLTWSGTALAVTGTLSATGLATLASSQITGATFSASGSGLELVFQSGISKLQSYNRTGSVYLPLTIDATTVGVLSSGTTIGAFSSTGLAVTGALSATGNLTSPTLQLGTNPAGVSIGVLGIPNQKRVYGRNAANSADVNILYVDGSNGLVLGPSDAVLIEATGALTVPGNIRGFQSTSLQLLANQYTDIVYAGAGGYGTLISGILTVYSTYSGAITQNSYFCNAVGNGNAGNGVSMLASGDYSTASNFVLYSRGAALGGGSYVISVYNASGNTVNITYSFTPVGQGNGAAYYNSLTNNGSAGAGTGVPTGVSVVFGQINTEVKTLGVTFPATQSASSNANTLDDYEEGTWTPTLTGDGGGTAMTYTSQIGKYTKIGNVVIADAYILLSNRGTITGNVIITGLPFVGLSTYNVAINWGYYSALGVAWASVGGWLNGGDTIYLAGQKTSGTTITTMAQADVSNTFRINVSVTYTV